MKYIITWMLIIAMLSTSNLYAKVDNPSSWARESIESLEKSGIFTEEIFSNYQKPMTRIEFAYIAVRIYELLENKEIQVDSNINFSDTEDIYAMKAATIGLTQGIGENAFGPELELTREQLVTMIMNTLENTSIQPENKTSFTYIDDSVISSWAKIQVYNAYAEGIVTGNNQGLFNPKAIATKEMAFVIVNRVLEQYMEEEGEDKLVSTNVLSGEIAESEPINLPRKLVLPSIDGKMNNMALSYYSRWVENDRSYLAAEEVGIYSIDIRDQIYIDILDTNYELITSKVIDYELPIFGGFYNGETYKYIVFGQNNYEEDDNKEVIRIVKYDKDFNVIDRINISDCYTSSPFEAGRVSISENEKQLVLHTSRLRYETEDGLRHQSQLTIVLDKSTGEITNDLGEFQKNHVSHSFDQFVIFDGQDHVLLDHGDAFPRAVVMNKGDGNTYSELSLFDIPGDIGANQTGISLGGFNQSSDNYIALLLSVDHTKVDRYTSFVLEGLDVDQRDIIIAQVDKNSVESGEANATLNTIVKYVDSQYVCSIPKLIKINDNRFVIMWQEFKLKGTRSEGIDSSILKYLFVDGSGNQVSQIYEDKELVLTQCQPIIIKDYITWLVVEDESRYISSLKIPEFY